VTAVADVDAMSEEAFVATFGSLFEHSPWVAREAWRRRPFGSRGALHAAFEAAMRSAPHERQLALIRAHPELAGWEAEEGELTEESSREQVSAGLDRLSPAAHGRLKDLNRRYNERFGFPLIVCAREHTSESLLAWGGVRLERSREEEEATALNEIAKIADLRLAELVT
jgi:OHCU decarboxylase